MCHAGTSSAFICSGRLFVTVPEPSSFVLTGVSVLGVLAAARRRSRQATFV
jgi:hypothetical protein